MKSGISAETSGRRDCEACGSCSWKLIPDTNGGAYLCCQSCRYHVQTDRRAEGQRDRFEEEQQRFYSHDPLCVTPMFNYLQQQRNDRRIKALQRHLPSGRILEVGPGGGDLLPRLAALDYRVDAVEHSPALASSIRERWAIEVRDGAFEKLSFDDASYDAFLSFHVIEHVPDVAAHLSKAASVVTKGGYAFLATPNADSWEHRIPFGLSPNYSSAHLQLFSRRSLTLLLEKTGWQVVEMSTPSYADAWLRVATSVLRRLCGKHRPGDRGQFARGTVTRRHRRGLALFSWGTRPFCWLQELLSGGNELLLVARRNEIKRG